MHFIGVKRFIDCKFITKTECHAPKKVFIATFIPHYVGCRAVKKRKDILPYIMLMLTPFKVPIICCFRWWLSIYTFNSVDLNLTSLRLDGFCIIISKTFFDWSPSFRRYFCPEHSTQTPNAGRPVFIVYKTKSVWIVSVTSRPEI